MPNRSWRGFTIRDLPKYNPSLQSATIIILTLIPKL